MAVKTSGTGGSVAAKQREQALMFSRVGRVCSSVPACTRLTVWGVTDRWTSDGGPDEAPLLFDVDFQPKAALGSLREALATPVPALGP